MYDAVQREDLKESMHSGFGNATLTGCFPDRPVRATFGFARQRALQQRCDLLVLNRSWTSRTYLIIEASQPMLKKTLPPFANGGFCPAQAIRDLAVTYTFG